MLPVSGTLLAAARSASTEPLVRVVASDRDLGVLRLRPVRWYEGVEPDGPCGAATPADGSLVRARIDPADGTLYVQRVATPSPSADYASWTSLGTVEAGAGVGLHAAGTYVALAYYDGAAVRVRVSGDSGGTFAAASALAFDGAVTAVACAIRADGSAAVTWASGGDVYEVRRTGTGAWGSPAAWTPSLAAVSGLAMMDDADWCVFVSGEAGDGQAGAWTTRLGSGLGAPPGEWTPLTPVILAAPGTDVTYRAIAAAHAAGPRLALVESYLGSGAFDQPMLAASVAQATFDDHLWRDPVPSGIGSAYGCAIAAAGDHAYLCTPSGVWHASLAAADHDLGAAVLDARYEAGAQGERLRLVLAPAEGDDVLTPGAEIAFEPGYVTSEGAEHAEGRRLWVTSVERAREGGRATVTVEAHGALRRLQAWRAPRQLTWAAGESTILATATAIARSAGVLLLTSSPSTAATTLTPAFTVRAGESAAAALDRLLARTADALLERGPSVILAEHDPEDEAAAAFGEADDAFAIASAVTVEVVHDVGWARVLGEGVAAQAVSLDAGVSTGVAIAVDDGITDAGVASARATAMLRRSELMRDRAWIESSVHSGLERGDAVEVGDPAIGLDGIYRVIALRIDVSRRPRGRSSMRVTLGAR